MSATKTTVTHADGTVSTRTSKTRTYTHAIEVGPAPAEAMAAAKERRAAEYVALAATLRAAAETGKVTVRDRRIGARNELITHVAKLAGTEVYTWCSADGRTEDSLGDAKTKIVEADGYVRESARHSAASYEASAATLRAEAASIREAGVPVVGYSIVRWSSSSQLATAALGSFKHFSEEGRTVRVVAVDGLADKNAPVEAEAPAEVAEALVALADTMRAEQEAADVRAATGEVEALAEDVTVPATQFDPALTYFADATRVVMTARGEVKRGVTTGRKPGSPYDFQVVRWDDGGEDAVAPHVLTLDVQEGDRVTVTGTDAVWTIDRIRRGGRPSAALARHAESGLTFASAYLDELSRAWVEPVEAVRAFIAENSTMPTRHALHRAGVDVRHDLPAAVAAGRLVEYRADRFASPKYTLPAA